MWLFLLERGADPNAAIRGETPLHWVYSQYVSWDSCLAKREDIFKMRVKFGADVNANDKSKRPPLDIKKSFKLAK